MRTSRKLTEVVAGMALAVCLVATAACGGTPTAPSGEVEVGDTQSAEATDEAAEPTEDEETELSDFRITLDGTPTTAPGANTKGDVSLEKSPVAVSVTDVTCSKKTTTDVGYNDENEPVALTAPAGEQLCLVSVSVKNTGRSPAFWSATDTEVELQDGSTWAMFDGAWSGQQIAEERNKDYSGDSDLINPGKTEYDYLLFALPEDQRPSALIEPNNGY